MICDTTMMYWSTILANIATIITGISAFTALICLLRNACLKKKLNCNIFVSEVCKTIKRVKALKLFITFSNPSEMEKKIGVTQPTVCHYERDLRTPGIQTIKKIAKILDTSVDYLVNDK